MEKFSVKKPFTVLVAVIMVIMLGLVSVQNMQTNLLPNVNTPYLMVVTVYPGASPERVENEVSDVMESALGTISGVKNVTATSAENYSLLLMEFEDDTDMNSAVVKVSNKVDQTTASLPSTCMTPSIIEYTLNMNAFMTVAVSREGSDSYELADFVNDTMVPYIERQGGVSNISANGLVTRMVQVQLDQEKIDAINEKLLEVIDVQLADAKAQLDDAEAQIEAGRKEYETQLASYDKLVSDTINSQYSGELQDSFMLVKKQAQALLESVNQLIAVVNEPEIQQALIDVRDGLQRVVDKFNETGMQDIDSLIEIVAELRDITDKLTTALQDLQQRLNAQGDTAGTTAGELVDDLQVQQSLSNIYNTLESTIKAMDDVPGLMDQFTQIVGSYSQQQLQAYIKFTEAREMLNNYEQQLADAKQQYEDAKQKAMENSDVAKMLDINTLAQLIYAQNFSMPAGYVKDSSNKSWLLKVGEEYDSIEDISGALLLHVDGFGDVRLSDVADVQIIETFNKFKDKFYELSKKAGKKQYLVPYLMSSHPGSTLKDAVYLAEYLYKNHMRPEQVQDFYPTPGTVSTCMFYTGLDPYTLKPVFVEKTPEGKALQRALLQYYEPRNAEKVVKALQLTHREDLIPLLVPAVGRRAVQRTARRAESAEVTIHNDGTYTVHPNQKGRGTGKNARTTAPAGRQPSPGARFAPNSAPGHKPKNNQQKENATWKTGKKKK